MIKAQEGRIGNQGPGSGVSCQEPAWPETEHEEIEEVESQPKFMGLRDAVEED